MTQALVGIDLGGTNVRVGVFDRAGNLISLHSTPIEAKRGPIAGLRSIGQLIDNALDQADQPRLLAVGVGATGPVDRSRGVIQNPYTLPTWEDVDIITPLQTRYQVPVALENDADAALLGEYWRGVGQGANPLYMVTIGTGVGSACMIAGKLHRGAGDFHPEAGHMIIDPSGPQCYCGARGCLESLVAGPALARRAQERSSQQATLMLDLVHGQLAQIDAAVIARAAEAGDPIALELLDRVGYWLGLGLVNIIRTVYPQKILLSGGVTRSYAFFREKMEATVCSRLVLEPDKNFPIQLAGLGELAGVNGAAYAALQMVE